MRNSTFFKMLLLAAALLTGGRIFSQVNIIPKLYLPTRNNPIGTEGWTITNATINNASNDYWKMLSGSSLETPAMDFTNYSNIKISLSLASFGTIDNHSDDIKVEYWNGTIWTQVGLNIHTTSTTTTTLDLPYSYSAAKLKITAPNATNAVGARVYSVEIKGIPSGNTPTITVSPSTLTGFTYNHGSGPSAEQSFTVSGSNLTANISLAAPTNYEISTSSGSGFGSSLTLTQSEGTVASTTIYVRLKAGLAVGNYNGEDLTLSSTDASDKTVTLSGSVGLAAPTAAAATNISTTGFTANWGAVSGASEYKLDVFSGSVFLDEDFSSITTGDNTTTTGSSSSWVGNTNFPTVSTAYQAGGAVRIGKSDGVGSITSKAIDLSSGATLTFDVKGWTTVEGDIKVSVDGGTVQTVTYTAKIADAFETKTVTLASATASSTVKIETSAKRAFLDNIKISNKVFVENYENLTVNSTSKNVTGLTPNTKYTYTVKAKSGSFESASSDEIEVTTGKLVNSAKNGNWSDHDTWSSGAVPEAKDAITIVGGHTITQDANDASCSALTIQAGGKLIVSSGKHLTVSGDITNNAGNVGLLLESDATGTASLIHSNAGVQATAERYLTGGWAAADGGWHLISSPVAAQAITAFTTSGDGNGYDFYGWDEPSNTWMNQKDGGFNDWNGSVNFVVGRGYMVSYEQNQTLSFNGALNASDVTISGLTKSGNTYSGWHLLGNPYASAIRWNNGGGEMTLNNLNDNAKIWHEGIKSYSDIGKGGIIPSAQGFMVQATDHNAGITIKLAARVHNNQAFYKNGSGNMVLLVAAEASGASAQESKLLLNSAATAGFDAYHDALFLSGYAPQFFSVSDNEQLSTNAMPDFDDKVIPFGFVKNQADQYIIRLQESPAGMMLKLTDKKTGTVTNLSEHNSYAFSAEEGDDVMRFELEMNALGIGESPKTSTVRLYAYNGYVYLSGLAAPTNFVMTDITGRMVMTKHFNNTGQASLNTGKLPKGVYVVTAITGGQVVSAKVVL